MRVFPREPIAGDVVVLCIELDADLGTAQHLRGNQGRAGASERVEHDAV
jgi:hypothetical protein